MEQTYYTDKTVNLKHLSDDKKLVCRRGEEVGVVFVNRPRPNSYEIVNFTPRCFEKGDGPKTLTLTEAVNWILYSKG